MSEVAAPSSCATGELRLDIARRPDGRSYAAGQFHRGALRVLRPLYLDLSGQVSYTVINPGGAYLGADTYEVDMTVAQDASLLLTTQSATKVYRTPQGPAVQHNTFVLESGAVLESLPDQVIVYREGSYRQNTRVVMHPEASLVMVEVITPGWSPTGEGFTYDDLRMRTEIIVGLDEPAIFAVDQLRLVPDTSTTGMGVMEGFTHVGQVLVADARVNDDLVDEVASLVPPGGVRAAVSRIGIPAGPAGGAAMSGLALRCLGMDTATLTELNLAVVNLLRRRWRGQAPVTLRKY